MKGDGEGASPGEGGAATSDLFFGLAGILIVLVCLISGPVREAVGSRDLAATISAEGHWLVVADGQGVALMRPDAAPMRLRLDEIAAEALIPWAQGADLPFVVLTSDAVDSAFLLDSALAAAGITEVRRIRLDADCPRPRIEVQGLVCDG